MNRCLRSLSCVLTLTALALFSTEASARTNPKTKSAGKTQEAKKPEAKKQETKKQEAKPAPAAKEARPQRAAAAGACWRRLSGQR